MKRQDFMPFVVFSNCSAVVAFVLNIFWVVDFVSPLVETLHTRVHARHSFFFFFFFVEIPPFDVFLKSLFLAVELNLRGLCEPAHHPSIPRPSLLTPAIPRARALYLCIVK